MKDSLSPPPPPPPPYRSRGLVATIPAVAVFFLLGYVLGLLSASSSSSEALNATANKVTAVESSPSPPPHDLFKFRDRCTGPVPHPQVLQTILSRAYNGTSPYAGFPSAETSAYLLPVSGRLRGWGSRNRVFYDLIASVRPRVVIELGTFLGASALHMAAVTRNLSLPDTIIVCVDDFRGWPGFRAKFPRDVPPARHGDSMLLHQFMAGVAAAGEGGRVVPMPFSTGSALAALCEWGVYGDLVEVDAGHDFHSAWADINMAWAVLRPGGVMFGHDYFTVADDRGVRRAVNLFAKAKGLRVRANGEHWVLSPKPHGSDRKL